MFWLNVYNLNYKVELINYKHDCCNINYRLLMYQFLSNRNGEQCFNFSIP
jgi:hypothetical protein